jgi:hypothetical protein
VSKVYIYVVRYDFGFAPNPFSSQCLDRRISDKQTLIDEIPAWEHDRNANHTKANWHFATPNARIKLKHLYPSI